MYKNKTDVRNSYIRSVKCTRCRFSTRPFPLQDIPLQRPLLQAHISLRRGTTPHQRDTQVGGLNFIHHMG